MFELTKYLNIFKYTNHIGGEMVSVLELRSVQTKARKLVFAASELNTQNYGVRSKTGWLRICIIFVSAATCEPADCFLSELALYKSNLACCPSTKRKLSLSHLIIRLVT